MKAYINRRVVRGPWGGGNLFVKAYHEFGERPGIELLRDRTLNINPEVILLAGLENDGEDIGVEQAIMYKLYVKPECQLVLRVNENDARKGTDHMDEALLKVSEHIDATVFVSHWLQDYFVQKGWACKNQTVIYNGVDRDIFKPQPKLNNGKLNIVAHHWSDNYMKGFDIYDKLDEFVGANSDKFAFTYIGRERGTFKNTKVVRPLSGKPLGEELGKHDVYVSASRFDPGPNHILESIACELPTYVHKEGGGAVEFAGSPSSYSTFDELEQLLQHSRTLVGHPSGCHIFPYNGINLSTWQECVGKYNDFLEATWQSRSNT